MNKISYLGYTSTRLFWQGALTVVAGVLLIVFTRTLAELVVDLFLLYLLAVALYDLAMRFFGQRKDNRSLLLSLAKVIGLVIVSNTNLFAAVPVYLMVLLIGLYELLLSFINIVTFLIYRNNRIRPRWRFAFNAIWLGVLGAGTALSPATEMDIQLSLLGAYLIMRGLTNIRDGWTFDQEASARQAGRRSRVSLPIVVAALIPRTTLKRINDFIADHNPEDTGTLLALNYDVQKGTITPDLEVFIHVTEAGFGAIGHVDVSYDGTVYSYGNYDDHSARLFGMIGDGVLFEVERERYIEFCKIESGKTLLGYGMILTEQQRAGVEEQIAQIKSRVLPWNPGPAAAEQQTYAHALVNATGAQLYKFTEGKFKTYFVLSTNCVLLADSIIGRAGTDILNASGFIAPGTYQDYLNREFEKSNSLVVSKHAYK